MDAELFAEIPRDIEDEAFLMHQLERMPVGRGSCPKCRKPIAKRIIGALRIAKCQTAYRGKSCVAVAWNFERGRFHMMDLPKGATQKNAGGRS